MCCSYDLGLFDLIYVLGLYNYLLCVIVVCLIQWIFELIKLGGEFIFFNYIDEMIIDGYMEVFMDWFVICCNEENVWDIIRVVIDCNVDEVNVFYGSNCNIVYGKFWKWIQSYILSVGVVIFCEIKFFILLYFIWIYFLMCWLDSILIFEVI